MNFIKSLAKSVLANGQLKKKYLTVSRIDDSSNKEREVQDVGDKDKMYELLLDDIDAETLMNEDDFEIDTGSRDVVQGVKQEDPVLKDEEKLAARERQGPHTGEEQVDGRSRHKQTVVTNERICHLRLWPHGN